MSTLIWDFQPIVIIALALLILRERVTRPLGAFSLLATLGVVLVAGVGLNAQGDRVLIGNLVTVTGVFICSTYFVLTRRIASTLEALPLVTSTDSELAVCVGVMVEGTSVGHDSESDGY
jgi:drug/metabolite transporter (DMT)-like permease